MEQWRLLLRTLAFLLFAAVVYIVLLTVVPQRASYGIIRNLKVPLGRYGHSFTRLQEVEQAGKVDVLFLGSSLAYRGYDVRIFERAGYTSFNLGSSAQTPVQTEMLVQRYLHELDPELVVLEVIPNNFARDGVESAMDLLANGPADIHALHMTRRVGHLYAWNALLYRWCRERILGPREFSEPARRGTDTYIPGGYVQRDPATSMPGPFRPGPAEEPYAFQEEAFHRLLALFKAKDIPVVLVNPSVTRPYYAHYRSLEEFNARMATLGTYLDMNQLLRLDDSLHFYDSHHLDQSGVELYNAAVLEQLRQRGLLPAR